MMVYWRNGNKIVQSGWLYESHICYGQITVEKYYLIGIHSFYSKNLCLQILWSKTVFVFHCLPLKN